MLSRCFLRAVALAAVTPLASAQIQLLNQFNPAQSGSMNSIGFDPVGDMVYAHTEGGPAYERYDRSGAFMGTVSKPLAGGNDDDIEFVDQPVTISGVTVPAGTLIAIENDNDPPRIIAVDPANSTVLATLNIVPNAVGSWVGGAYSKARGTFFCVDWTGDEVQEIDPANGAVLSRFAVRPAGATPFDIFYGDLDVLDADGNIYLVSSSQSAIRVMSPEGFWYGDIDLTPLGISAMSGIGFDDARAEAWISGTNGLISQIGGISPVVPCSPDIADDFGNPLVRDFQVTFGDFLALLALVGPCPGGNPGCQGDIADNFGFPGADGVVDFGDFLYLLGQVGPCD